MLPKAGLLNGSLHRDGVSRVASTVFFAPVPTASVKVAYLLNSGRLQDLCIVGVEVIQGRI